MKPELIIAIATVMYAIFTGLIIWEMRKDRKLLHQPSLGATLKKAQYPDWLLFSLKNVGKGPALKCGFVCKDDGELEWKPKEATFLIENGETIDIKFEVTDTHKKAGERIYLEIEYKNIFGKIHKELIYNGEQRYIVNTFGTARGD